VKLDPRRTFNESERRSILAASGGLCQLCQTALDPDDAEIDHIVPWIRGGKTTVENGRAVHWNM
jgi:5-methylcytosine-specific restriction endonuclease McrA